MEKKTRLNQIDKITKDRGDNSDKLVGNDITYTTTLADRGDTEIPFRKEKIKVNRKKIDNALSKINEPNQNLINTVDNKEFTKIIDKKDNKTHLNCEHIMKIKEKYEYTDENVIYRVNLSNTPSNDLKNDKSSKILKKSPKGKDSSSGTSKKSESGQPEVESHITKRTNIKNSKTITKNHSTKCHRTLTVADEKKPTSMQIKLPKNVNKSTKVDLEPTKIAMKTREPRKLVKASANRVSVKRSAQKRSENKKPDKSKRATSPDVSTKILLPPTEAKWANCMNNHTKQYYEAWVDTTLTAISKKSNDKSFWEKLVEEYQRALSGKQLKSDLVYEDLADERFTGRIKIRHK